jgi:hypothetical protein
MDKEDKSFDTNNKSVIYQTSGLNVISNNNNVVPRDASGNVMLHEDSINPLLIIESTIKKITLKSILKVIDTQFKYFKFPATNFTIIDDVEELDLNLDYDPIYARYKPSENIRVQLAAEGGAGDQKYNEILMDDIDDGFPQKRTNQYYITKEIKNSGKDLRFRIVLEHRYDSYTPDVSGVYFSLIKSSVAEGTNKSFITFYDQTTPGYNWWDMTQYQVKRLKTDDVILNQDFEIGDTFSIGAFASDNGYYVDNPDTDGIAANSSATTVVEVGGVEVSRFTRRDRDGSTLRDDSNYHTINAVTSYWVITDASKNVDEWNQEIIDVVAI